MTKETQAPHSEADPAWKTLLEVYFPRLMEFFWPTLYEQIDWRKGFESLDSELQAVSRQAAIGKRIVDKLFQVHSLPGKPWRVLTHVEIQAQRQSAFERRMFDYYCRIYVLKSLPLITLVILADDDMHWRPQGFEIGVWGQPVIRFNFSAVKILDYRGREAALAHDPNPFAAVVCAQLAALETKRDPLRRFDLKWDLTRRLYKKNLTSQEIQHLYLFIDWVLALPDDLEGRYNQTVEQFEEAHKVEFITGMERRGIKKGIQQGMQQGIQQGMQQGIQQGMQQGIQQGVLASLVALLQTKFKGISLEDYEPAFKDINEETLPQWIKRVLEANTPEDVFKKSA